MHRSSYPISPRPTNFRVGAILLSRSDSDPTFAEDTILSTGYTMELAGNTHAEQCCLANFASVHGVADEDVGSALPATPRHSLVMYVTMEPCGKRLSGNTPCAARLAATRNAGRGIQKVYFGVKEPGTFVGESVGCAMLSEAGIEWEYVSGFEKEILEVAFAGHENPAREVEEALEGIRVEREKAEEKKREEAPRNPKKRMMEGETLLY